MARPKLPRLTKHGLLRAGVHPMTLEQIEALFGRFQGSDRRPRLMRNLRDFVVEVRSTGWAVQILVDGSFVMPQVDRPEDIDILLVLPANWDFHAALRPFEYNLLWRKRTQAKYEFDVFVAASGSAKETQLIEFFQQVNVRWCRLFGLPMEQSKGIVKVVP